ncbi:hypothetical protein [Nocardioides daphniae]|uniref:Uncharacterized protein n=1 Tax=Nocardioides daphniae TaxID=402297 RepID=A0A4P7U9U8_9ACTN|nr:hypothetical protein [Nocardioides daphniae]QCC76394.1 hypothetical protein E2C04_02715 [Nocardioides daphniae]GGD07263.1 hypothetical protein GCM10007231_02460 [Nocardioides daphniae]
MFCTYEPATLCFVGHVFSWAFTFSKLPTTEITQGATAKHFSGTLAVTNSHTFATDGLQILIGLPNGYSTAAPTPMAIVGTPGWSTTTTYVDTRPVAPADHTLHGWRVPQRALPPPPEGPHVTTSGHRRTLHPRGPRRTLAYAALLAASSLTALSPTTALADGGETQALDAV